MTATPDGLALLSQDLVYDVPSETNAVFDRAVAALAGSDPAHRVWPLRTVIVADRRLAVQAALDYARTVADAANRGPSAAALRAHHPGGLAVTALGEEFLTLDPSQPALAAATPGRVAACLLNRAGGASATQRPLAAALAGTDTLYVLLGEPDGSPLVDTLRAAACHHHRGGGPGRPVLVRSAVHRTLVARARDPLVPPESRHLPAGGVTLDLSPGTGTQRASTLAAHARALAATTDGGHVAVVCQTTAAARATHRLLAGRDGTAARLYTGTQRAAAERLLDGTDVPPFVVLTPVCDLGGGPAVASMVTDCAPLPVLHGRFSHLTGPVDPGRVVICAPDRKSTDPATHVTWDVLRDAAADTGGGTVTAPLPARDPGDGGAPPFVAPLLADTHLQAFAWTTPHPYPDPVAWPFAGGTRPSQHPAEHGPRGQVRVCWRGDLPADAPWLWPQVVKATPPRGDETLTVPVGAARDWLSVLHDRHLGHAPVVVSQAGQRAATDPAMVAAGDTLVSPSAYGGADQYGWAPDSTRPVSDLYDHADPNGRRRITRLHPGLADRPLDAEQAELLAALARPVIERDVLDPLDPAGDAPRELGRAVAAAARAFRDHTDPPVRLRLGELAAIAASYPQALRVTAYPDGRGAIISWPRRIARGAPGDVTLTDHHLAAASHADRIAGALRLPGREARTVAWAAAHHDHALAHPVYQAAITGDLGGSDGETLRRAGTLPPPHLTAGHELAGAIELADQVPDGIDSDLALHLVAASHGYCRPLPHPAAHRGDHPALTAGIDGPMLADRFARLTGRYGLWGLAVMETILRAADRAAHRDHDDEAEDSHGDD